MWRRTLLAAAVLVCWQSARAQGPYPTPGSGVGPDFPSRGAVPGLNTPPLTPGAGAPTLPNLSGMPTVAPSAPFVTAPSGPNPGLVGPAFTPAPPAPLETTVAFEPEQAELRWVDSRWQLAAGNVFLKDFGHYEAEGREVLRVVRQLHLNTLTTLGSPRPIMEYWLANGEAPHGSVDGLRTLPIDAASLSAEQVQGQWCVHDQSRILFNFGQQGDACRQALAVIQRYGFTQVGYVGQVAPVMLVFLANPVAPAAPVAAAGGAADHRFPRLFGGAGQPSQPGATPGEQAAEAVRSHLPQPHAMPPVAAQSLNATSATPGMPLKQPGGITTASLRLPGTEAADRVAIDGRQLQVRHDGNDWKLAMGNHVVANFGPSEGDARLAQAALRYYRCTEQVFVGNPRPMFSYFLSNGQAPHGTSYAFNAVSFRPESLAVRQMGTSYVLYDGTQVLMSFADRAAEAQQALQAIQHYKFDRLATFGRGDQSMLMFVRTN